MSPPAATDAAAPNSSSDAPPLTVSEIYSRRKPADKSEWGVAASARDDKYRLFPQTDKPKAKRWDHRLSDEARLRKGNSLKQAAKYLGTPGLISLGGGLPSSEYFPFEELSIKVPAPGKFGAEEMREHGAVVTAGKHDLAEGKSIFDIATAFNYGQGSGSAQLLRWVSEHTELVHRPPYEDWRCTLTVGSTSALDMALRMFTRPGDYILSEDYTFASAVETAAPMGVRFLGVKMDAEGLLPDHLDEILSGWDEAARGARKPFLVYTVPTGQNPTGATQSAARRRDIYRVAQKHDLYILEDEPYYFLQMQPYTGRDAAPVPPPASHEAFLASLVPSYLSIDTDGRVMRMDSFSKVVAPGSRVGWVTATAQVVERYRKHADVSTQGPAGIAQLVLFKLLDEHWGHPAYLDWLLHIRLEYTRRRDVILAACEDFLPREVVSWNPPSAGMFHWLRIDWRRHPLAQAAEAEAQPQPGASTTSIIDAIEESLFLAVIAHGALLMRGTWFYADRTAAHHDTLFFRATFAAAPFDSIREAIRRVGVAVRESFGLPPLAVESGERR